MYPKDPKQKAIVDQRLFFDIGTLYPRIRAICVSKITVTKCVMLLTTNLQFPVLFLGEIEIPDEYKTALDEALGFLDVFLEGNDFVAGNKLTVADCCIVASVSSIVVRF